MSTLVSVVATASVLATVLLGAGSAYAQTARGGSSANAQLLQELQQLAAERSSLQAENAKMKKELDDLRKEREDLKKGQQAAAQRTRATAAALAQANSQHATTTQELEQTKTKLQELIAKFRETLQTLRQIESEGAAAKRTLAARDQELKVCVDRNLALYKLNGEILTHLEHESAWARLARAEPFTQIKRAELENLVDDYKARADPQRWNPGSAPALPEAPQAPPAGPPPTLAPSGEAPPAPKADDSSGR